ncbi:MULTISPECIES: hypothetical protein [unclassified Mesorhizobium]|uniref:hypothetical protein n=1 Tax=unclassified Mesorhizobium TaxID=325217 RepID=UPI0003CF7A2B|nr:MULTISPECIES: hypothetical protein [unclassified Mesorhizobium]ESY48979.1 hypothetical protein X745_27780 [Mesorhizobium sp. LNJC374B00]ESY52783.1 hypothetical protein X744_28820 [Mesorhizobium sp. LNJC372A00]WJI81504.1 hypothetical protein NLY34_01705 [Mesorhizobium sp. C374B]WJI88023.1 hypothetical protein NLY42_04120 [Mesorhizobium sp. C372A]
MTKCAAPACRNDAPGRHGIFCVDHYFQLPKVYTGLLTRMKIECSRCADADAKKHLDEQLAAYINVVISKLPHPPEARSSQAALDSARRSPTEPAAGASQSQGRLL